MEYDLTKLTPDVRKLNDMRDVLCDANFAKNAPDINLYSMYRDMEMKDEIRYDITVIPQNMLGKEFVKTIGHYHPEKYGEVYTVLEGEAIYLMQKKSNQDDAEVEDVYAVKCKKGDVVIIPSFYGHTTINPSKTETLTMANWVSDNFKSDYSLYKKLHGACYYYTENGWIKNENYKSVPDLRFEEPLKEVPQDLNFLK